jgi:hypothetical protein
MRSIGFKLGLAIMAVASVVSAGSTSSKVVTHNSATETTGVVRDARFSASAIEFIGCLVRSNGLVLCIAKSAGDVYRSCSTTAAGFATVAAGIGPNTLITMNYNAAGTCTALEAYNTSIYLD